MSVIGHGRNETATLHLAKIYCAPAAMYGCETWHLDRSDYRRLNVAWNNSFRRIYGCCWRESVACLQFYCHTLPMAYTIDQRKILFWKKVLMCGIQVVRTLAILNKGNIGMILSKYVIPSLAVSVADIKSRMWMHFVDASYDKL